MAGRWAARRATVTVARASGARPRHLADPGAIVRSEREAPRPNGAPPNVSAACPSMAAAARLTKDKPLVRLGHRRADGELVQDRQQVIAAARHLRHDVSEVSLGAFALQEMFDLAFRNGKPHVEGIDRDRFGHVVIRTRLQHRAKILGPIACRGP